MCRSWRMWAMFGGVAFTLAVAFPGARSVLLPALLLAACPLSMVLMGLGMTRATRRDRNSAAPRASSPEHEPVTL